MDANHWFNSVILVILMEELQKLSDTDLERELKEINNRKVRISDSLKELELRIDQ